MTLRELGKVYPGKVQVTVLGYYSNGEYYSFYTALKSIVDPEMKCDGAF